MNIDKAQAARLVDELKQHNITVSVPEIESVAANTDEEVCRQEFLDSMKAELWDKTSHINGVSAEEVLSLRTDIPEGGEVYLIRNKEGQVVIFQPFDPTEEGFKKITKTNWKSISDNQRNIMADQHVESVFRENVSKYVNNKES